MSRKFVRRGFKLGAVIGAVFFLAQVFLRKQAPKPEDNATRTPVQPKLQNASPEATAADEVEAPAVPVAPSVPAAAEVAAEAPAGDDLGGADAPWLDPLADGTCPVSHPVKAKLSSKIFHVPGGLAYDRTTPDRCYRDAPTAEADGFRAAKR